MSGVTTIDCHYLEREGFAAAYLIRDGDRAAFIETNTTHAVPRLLAALDAEGLSPEQVEYVIITHVHLDHAGGASALMAACPNATLLAHPRAAPHVIDPSKLVASASAVFASLYGLIEPVDAGRVRTLEDGESVALGARELTFLHTRGHANHHFCVLDPAADAIFTGDAFGVIYPALQKHGPFAVPSTSPTDFDADAARQSVRRIVESGARVAYPTHFGPYYDLAPLAAQLDAQLERYGRIVDEADASGLDGAALEARCASEVRALFEAVFAARGLEDDPDARALLETDAVLNAQGVAFAVQKRRHKRARAPA